MEVTVRWVSVAWMLTLSLTCGTAAGQSTRALDVVERSVVRVVGDAGTGSGAVVAPERVLTNWHVVDGQRTLAVVSAHTDGVRRAELIWSSQGLDLAVLAVDGLTLSPVTLGTMALRVRERVWALGYPGVADQISGTHDVTSTEGVVGRLHTAPWEGDRGRALDIIQHSADINPGNSGGPLVNNCGVVVGVNTAGFPSAQGTFLASRITEAARELRRLRIRFDETIASCEDTAVQAAANADTARDEAAQAVAAAGAAVDAANDLREEANRNLWLVAGVGAVAVPALLLALRKPREVVRVVERVSRSMRSVGQAAARHRVASRSVSTPACASATGEPVLLLAAGPGAAGEILVRDTGLGRAAGGFVVGSHAPLVDCVVADRTVSRRHARITCDGPRFFLEDLNSSNGTRVNGVALDPFMPQAIGLGDGVQLGAMAVLSVQPVRP